MADVFYLSSNLLAEQLQGMLGIQHYYNAKYTV